MARGGGKKRGAQPRSGGGGGSSTHWKWMLVGIAVGWLSAFGVYLLKILPTAMDLRDKQVAAADCAPGEKAGDKPAKTEKPASETPVKIEFYDVLPKQQVVVPVGGDRTTVATPPPVPGQPAAGASPATATPAAAAGPRYALQAGSFRTRGEADARRGALTLSGFSASVQEAKTDKGETWFRVMVGPFAGEAEMQKARQALAAQKVDTLPVRLK